MIRLVDVTLGIIPESSSIAELTKFQRTGASNRTYAECKDVLWKLLELNEDLLKNSQYSLSPETVDEQQEIFDKIKRDENQGEACAAYKVTFLEAENIEDDSNSFSTTDSSIRLEQNPISFGSLQHVQSTEFGPYMMDQTSFSSGELFPSQIQEPDEETAEKQLEGDISVLQTATQSLYFQDLHPE
ncbi:uncharacterized protein LOC134712505 [Mytilus trossulus]|uniref:uncharacterized protein LOC134712505 n=1 Tax=Mytilus trossulus TaxID=6551 RepID=UPI0030046DBB